MNEIENDLKNRGYEIIHHDSSVKYGLYILYIQLCTCCSDQDLSWDEDDEDAVEPTPDYKKLPFFVNPAVIDNNKDLDCSLGIYSCGGHYTNIRIGMKDNNGNIKDITSNILGKSERLNDDLEYFCL